MCPSSEFNDGINHRFLLDDAVAFPQHGTGDLTPSTGLDPTRIRQPESALGASKRREQQRRSSDRIPDSQHHPSDATRHDSQSAGPHNQQQMAAGQGLVDPYLQSSLMEQACSFNAGYHDVEIPYHSGVGWVDEAPNDYSGLLTEHGMPNHARLLDAARGITSQVGVARKKRSHEELDGDRSSRPSTRLSDHRRLVRDQQPAASDLGSTPQGYASRPSQALAWDVVDDRKQLKGKKRRLDSGDAFAVSTTGPEEYPSARHRPDGPETFIGLYPRHRSLGIRSYCQILLPTIKLSAIQQYPDVEPLHQPDPRRKLQKHEHNALRVIKSGAIMASSHNNPTTV